MKLTLTSLCVLFLGQGLVAQEPLQPQQPVSRTLATGKTDMFSLVLNDGDYFALTIGYKGRVNFSLLNPDRTIARRIVATSSERRLTFPFAAEGAGSYSFLIENAGDQQASYEFGIGPVTALGERLRPEPWVDPNPSPRIQTLLKQVQSGNANTDAFWKDIAAQGTPLVEPFASDGKYQLVTFLWRGVHATRNVAVRGSFLGVGSPADYAMHQIGNSDVWYLTLKLPSGARFTYQLSPNDPLTLNGARSAQRSATAQADPLNARRFNCQPNASKFICESAADLTGAAPQPWLVSRASTPAGRVEKHIIRSAIQNVERQLAVYTPSNYRADGPPNALVILFDGEDLSNNRYPVTTLDNLIAAGRIPPTVAVFVENRPGQRLVDLVANAEFADFMAQELVPWVRTHYHVTRDPQQAVVSGSSAGGLAAPYVALRHPDVFGNVLSQSGAFWWSFEHNGGVCGSRCPDSGGSGGEYSNDATTEGNFLVREFLARQKLPIRFFLTAGTFEIDRNGGGGNILESTRHLRDVLLAKGYDVTYEQFVGGHDGLSWRGMLADGLIALLGSR